MTPRPDWWWPWKCPKCDGQNVTHTLVHDADGTERMDHKCPCGADLGRTLTRDKMPDPPPYVPEKAHDDPKPGYRLVHIYNRKKWWQRWNKNPPMPLPSNLPEE